MSSHVKLKLSMIETVLKDSGDIMDSGEIFNALRARFGSINRKAVYAMLSYGSRKERIARLELESIKGPHPQFVYHSM